MKKDLQDKIGDKNSVVEWITCLETSYFRNRMQASLLEAEACEALPNSESILNVFLRIPKVTKAKIEAAMRKHLSSYISINFEELIAMAEDLIL